MSRSSGELAMSRVSTQKTSCPSSSRRRHRWVPMNPTPPSTTILFCIFFPFTGEKQNPFHTGGNPAGSPCEVGRFALRNFCRVFRRQLAVVRSKDSYEQASAGRSCGLPIHPRRIENLPAATARSRSFPYLLFLMSAYSVKSAFGSWSTLFIGTTSMPLGRLPPLAR